MRVLMIILAWLFFFQSTSVNSQTLLAKDKLSLAVLARYAQKSLPTDLENMVDTISTALSKSEHYTLMPAHICLRKLHNQGAVGPFDADLDQLKGRFQKGYIQSYEFRYAEAVRTLKEVIAKLNRAPDQPERWTLYLDSLVHLGRSYVGLRQSAKARASFMQALQSRPDMSLSSKKHPPKIIKLFQASKEELARAKQTNLTIQTDPTQAMVFLDGLLVGKTPYQAQHTRGSYLLTIKHDETRPISRHIQLDQQTLQIGFKLRFEAAVDLSQGRLAIHQQTDKKIPNAWWGWLSDRLQIQRAAVISKQYIDKRPRWVASLVDLQTGRTLREGWLEPSPSKPRQDALDLAHFVEAGTSQRVKQSLPKQIELEKKTDKDSAEPKKPNHKKDTQTKISSPIQTANPLEVSKTPTRPLGRTWWPYVLSSAVMAGVGIAAHIAAGSLEDTGGLADRSSAHKAWMGVAIGSYVAAGILSICGISLHYTFQPNPNHQARHTIQPKLGDNSISLVWSLAY